MIAKITKTAYKIRKWSVRNRPSAINTNLRGMCAIASFRLSCELNKYGIKNRIVVTDSHVWVEVDDLIIDITASQFTGVHQPLIIDKKSYDKLFCTQWKIPYKKRYFNNHKYMIDYLHKSGWPKFQIPS